MDKPRADRIGNVHEDNWNSARSLLHCANRHAADADDHVGCERDQFCGVTAKAVDIAANLAIFDIEVAADLPSQLLKSLLENCKPNFCFRIV